VVLGGGWYFESDEKQSAVGIFAAKIRYRFSQLAAVGQEMGLPRFGRVSARRR